MQIDDCINMNYCWVSLDDAIQHIEKVLEEKKSGKSKCWIETNHLERWLCALKYQKESLSTKITVKFGCFEPEGLKNKKVEHHMVVLGDVKNI